MKNVLRLKLCLVAALAAEAAAAQAIKPPHPADAAVPTPAARYDSVFAGYAPFRDEKLAPWREVNDEVARVGGHIGILRGSGAPTARTPLPPQPAGGAKSK